MDQKTQKRRKCGPRVKTGCLTCRIRRVKCDETKPACERCTSTGRKCDGYLQTATKPIGRNVLSETPEKRQQYTPPKLNIVPITTSTYLGSDKDRGFFHLYCVRSAFDLSVYMDSSFWYKMILQYSHEYPVVRQAVIALGASDSFAIRVNTKSSAQDEQIYRYEQARQYDKAIKCLRNYLEEGKNSDPRVVLMCCALFFGCENALGNREAALQHLERGLSIINAGHRKLLHEDKPQQEGSSHFSNATPSFAVGEEPRKKPADLDDELLYVFSRLDCQATLCQDGRGPVLDLDALPHVGADEMNTHLFRSVTDAQRALDVLHNRLAKFLTSARPFQQTETSALPQWVITQKSQLSSQCLQWELTMNDFVCAQSSRIQMILQQTSEIVSQKDPDWQLAIQIQLLTLHHRCWWMLFRSSYPTDVTVFTMSPNPRAQEILDICQFLGFALPIRPSSSARLSEADMAWRLISEVGVAAPLFVLATKCADPFVCRRAKAQLETLRSYRSGRYDKIFLTKVIESIDQQQEQTLLGRPRSMSVDVTNSKCFLDSRTLSDTVRQDQPSTFEHTEDEHGFWRTTVTESAISEEPMMELLGWGRRFSVS